MRPLWNRNARIRGLVLAMAAIAVLSGCHTTGQTLSLAAGGTAGLALTPGSDILQTYYLGIYDPQEQLAPPQFYRVRLRGQASAMSRTKFSSGWVRADLIDSLGTQASFDAKSGKLGFEASSPGDVLKLKTGRRLMLFGPEGFREAPADHRLVVVMGSSPDKFFEAIDSTLGLVAQARYPEGDAAYDSELVETSFQVQAQRNALARLQTTLQGGQP